MTFSYEIIKYFSQPQKQTLQNKMTTEYRIYCRVHSQAVKRGWNAKVNGIRVLPTAVVYTMRGTSRGSVYVEFDYTTPLSEFCRPGMEGSLLLVDVHTECPAPDRGPLTVSVGKRGIGFMDKAFIALVCEAAEIYDCHYIEMMMVYNSPPSQVA